MTWPESLNCAHLDTQYQSRQIKKKKDVVPNKFLNEIFTDSSVTAWSQKTFYLPTNNNFVLRWFSCLTKPCSITMLWIHTVYWAGNVQHRGACSSITIDSAAVPTLTRLQRTACIHLNLLTYLHYAASGRYHNKSITLPRAAGPTQSPDSGSDWLAALHDGVSWLI